MSYMAYLHNQYEQLFMYYTVWLRQDPAQNGQALRLHLLTSGAWMRVTPDSMKTSRSLRR